MFSLNRCYVKHYADIHSVRCVSAFVINEKGLTEILESNKLNPSLRANNPKDARYGNGQYLSDIKPGSTTPTQLAKEL